MKPLAVVFWLTIFLSLWPSARTSGAQGTAIGDPAAEPRDTISSDSTEGLQSMLRNTKTAVLNYSLGAGELRLQVITGKESRTFHMATGSVLLSSVIALKTSLQEGAIFDREAAHRLYKKLIMPALPMLTGKTHLVIIPGQITGQIPFETLVPDTGSDRFMLHDYAIRSEERRVGKGCVSRCKSRGAPDN